MKNVKIIFATLLFLIMFSINLNAQTQENQLPKVKNMDPPQKVNNTRLQIGITPEQQKPYDAIVIKYAGKFEELKASTSTKEEKLKAFTGLQSDKNAEVKKLLTEDQYKIYLRVQEERKEKVQRRIIQ